MTSFQIVMIMIAVYFAYHFYRMLMVMEENPERVLGQEEEIAPKFEDYIEEADKEYAEGNVEQARVLLENIVKVFPTIAEGMNKLAYVLTKEGNNQEALSYYKQSLRIDPEDDVTHNAVASVFSSLNREDEAIEHYQEALSIDSDYEDTWFNYGNLMLKMGKEENALKMYKRVLEINANFEEAKESIKNIESNK